MNNKSKAEILAEKEYDMSHCYTQEHVSDYQSARMGFVNGYERCQAEQKWTDDKVTQKMAEFAAYMSGKPLDECKVEAKKYLVG